jgi:aminoglycoside phosphotransferase (APT) family kinase protein
LQLVEGTSVPAPRPLLLDEDGTILGAPGIVTGFVEGHHVIAPGGDHSWATRLAATLVDIHAVECDAARDQLLDANGEALYFLRSGTVPNDMVGHPDGARVWHAVRDAAMSLVPVGPSLVHIDYWPGNILWQDGEIAAVVDWEEAACGDPAIDVAYMRMDMFVPGFRDDADVFLAAYERIAGRRLENLALWELAASARAMPDPGDGMAELRQLGYDGATEDHVRRNLRDFIASAMDRLW